MAHTTNIPDDIFDSASSCSEPRSPVSASGSSGSPGPDRPSNPRSERHHPYDKPAKTGTKTSPKSNRKMWHHALERPLFNIMELTTLGSPQRRPIYIASLEAHIDRLHTQLLGLGARFYPIDPTELENLKGLNSTTCKAMVASLHNDRIHAHARLLQLQRANESLAATLGTDSGSQ